MHLIVLFVVEMEDAESIHLSLKNHPGVALFGVFDGHNGACASQWLHDHLHEYIDKLEDPFSPEPLKKALLQADADFLATDNKCAQSRYLSFPSALLPSLGDLFIQSTEKSWVHFHFGAAPCGFGSHSLSDVFFLCRHNGSTCVFALVDHSTPKPWRLLVANIGDSRALLSRGGNTVALTKDHKPTNDEENSRIRAAGGYVEFGRVDGQLALSRAVGDAPYKQNKALPLEKQRVIALPDITLEQLNEGDALIVCCDGIFEALNNEETVKFTHEKMQESPNDPGYVAAQLLDNVLKKGLFICARLPWLAGVLLFFGLIGSRDNTTAIVIQLKDGSDFNFGAEFYPGPIQAFRDDPWFVDAYTKNAAFYGLSLDQALKRLEDLKKGGASPTVPATSIITALAGQISSSSDGSPAPNSDASASSSTSSSEVDPKPAEQPQLN